MLFIRYSHNQSLVNLIHLDKTKEDKFSNMAPFIAESEAIPEIPALLELSKNLTTTTTANPNSVSESLASAPTWQAVALRRKNEITDSIPGEWVLPPHILQSSGKRPLDLVKTCGLLSEREITIVYSNAVDLLEKMRKREYTAVEVTTAFCKASAVAHQAVRCPFKVS